MDYNLPENIAYCGEFVGHYSTLLYYSHIPTALVALVAGLSIYAKRRDLLSKILLAITLCFAAWSGLDLAIWLNYDKASVVMAAWAPIETFSTLMFALCLYFIDVFCNNGRDVSFGRKAFFAALLLPIVAYASTDFYLTGYDLQECTALESSFYIQYAYYLKVILSLVLVGFTLSHYRKAEPSMKKQILVLAGGVVSFILFFFVAGRVSEHTLNYSYELYGLFGMPIFIGFLAYLIVRFRAFQIRLIGAQALVLGLIAVVGSQFFFIVSTINKILNGATLVLVTAFGLILVRSVKREIEARHGLEKANARLKELDVQKTEFVSFATHQLRSPLGSIRGYASLLLDGDAGAIPEQARSIIEVISNSTKTLVNIVEDYLNVSRIELGTMKYALQPMDFKRLVDEVLAEQKVSLEARGLAFSLSTDGAAAYPISADPDKFKQVVMNVVDNSIKYTPQGSISLALSKDAARGAIRLSVVDTGVGIRPDVIPKLFQKFSRAPKASEANIHGTGLGLFIAKEIMAAHKGRIWAESEGEGKGSRFYIELPEAK